MRLPKSITSPVDANSTVSMISNLVGAVDPPPKTARVLLAAPCDDAFLAPLKSPKSCASPSVLMVIY